MQRRSAISLLVGASIAAGAAPVRAQSLDWETIAGHDGRYSFEMPRGYRYLTARKSDDDTLRQYVFRWNGGGLDFAIYDQSQVEDTSNMPMDLYVILKNMQTAVQKRWPGSTVLQQSEAQLGPAQGRSFTLGVNQGRNVVVVRIYYANARLYEVLALVPAADLNGPVVTRFLNSVRIVR